MDIDDAVVSTAPRTSVIPTISQRAAEKSTSSNPEPSVPHNVTSGLGTPSELSFNKLLNQPSLSSTIPMHIPKLSVMTEAEVTDITEILRRHIKPLLEELHTSRAERIAVDHVAEYYQRKLAAAATIVGSSRNSATGHDASSAQKEDGRKLKVELEEARDTVATLRNDNHQLIERLSQRDRTLAENAAELTVLRASAVDIPSLRARATAAESDRDASASRAEQEIRRLTLRSEADAENLKSLKEELLEVTAELGRLRYANNKTAAEAASAVQASETSAREARGTITGLRADTSRMQQFINKLQTELSTTRAAAGQLETSFRDEVAQLNKMCDLHEQRAKEAERRAQDCEEALAQERELVKRRSKKVSETNSLAPHVEVLLKDMEQALDARWHLLEKQKEEMERAREAEMHLTGVNEKLEREVKDIRFELGQARKEATRLLSQVEAQSEEITRLKSTSDAPQELLRQSNQFFQTPRPAISPTSQQWPGVLPDPKLSASPTDIGPKSVIPMDYVSPQRALVGEFSSTMREMSEIRRRHERLLESLRDNRVSFE